MGLPDFQIAHAAVRDFAELAVENVLLCVLNVQCAAALHADLHDAVVFASRFDRFAAFPDAVRKRLLDVYIFAGHAAEHGERAVPVVRRGDHDGVDRLVVEHVAIIGHSLRLVARLSF